MSSVMTPNEKNIPKNDEEKKHADDNQQWGAAVDAHDEPDGRHNERDNALGQGGQQGDNYEYDGEQYSDEELQRNEAASTNEDSDDQEDEDEEEEEEKGGDPNYTTASARGQEQRAPSPRKKLRIAPAQRLSNGRNQPSWMLKDPYSRNQQQQDMMDWPQQQEQKQLQESKKGNDGLKLRLELNLEIEIEIKAKIHGDLTLSLL